MAAKEDDKRPRTGKDAEAWAAQLVKFAKLAEEYPIELIKAYLACRETIEGPSKPKK